MLDDNEKKHAHDIVVATLELVNAHRNNERRQMFTDMFSGADEKATYIFEELQEEVYKLVSAILEADDLGCMLAGLPVPDREAKEYYTNLNNTLQNLPKLVRTEQQNMKGI